MKINRLLTAALIIIASVFTSCVKESVWDVKTGIDSSKAAPEGFSFDATLSSKSEIAVYWQGDKAKAAGAQSFLVQLTDSKNMDKGNTWDSKVSKVLQISDDPTANYESVKFTNLAEGSKYYVRVRANYPGSVYSEWAYIASPEGKPLLCEVGFGPSNPDAAAPESITYNASKSSNSSLAFDVVATAAKAAGASTLAYRLTNYESGLAVVRELPVETLSYAFTELELKSQHKASVAAIYETPEGGIYYSNWVVASETITTDAGQVKTELYEVGTGAVEDKGVRPRIRCNWATSSELGVEWTSTAFANPTADFDSEYNIQLYSDAACENLIVSWVIADKQGAGTQTRTPDGSSPRFLFSGLQANTTYYAVVTNNTSGMSSSIVEMKTAEFTPVTIPDAPAAAGDIILAEDFSELIWGGSLIYEYPGYSAENRNKVPFINATGVNPVGQTEADFYLVDSSVEMGLFNTVKVAYPLTRLANWASMTENNTQGGYILARPGHLKLGASSQIGRIVTPVLSCLSETATIELSFKAALYQSDVTSGGVWVITSSDNLSATQNLITNAEGADANVYAYELTKSNEWTTHTVEIKNVTPESRIMIGNVRTAGTVAGSDQQRMFVDDVIIKVVSYGGEAVELVPPTHTSITLTPAEGAITATWNPVEAATGYVLAYKKATEGEDAWTEVKLGKTQTSHTITGLKQLTTYEIKVKATASGGSESEWSSIVSATTPETRAVVTQRQLAATESQLGMTWSANNFEDILADIDDDWTIALYKDEALTDLHAQLHFTANGKPAAAANAKFGSETLWNWDTPNWAVPYSPRFAFSGLNPNTSYWLKVKNETKSVESVAAYKTTESNFVALPTTATAGSVVLYEDFSNLIWGGYRVTEGGIPGISSDNRDIFTEFVNISGETPLADEDKLFFLCRQNTEMGMFTTIGKAVASTRLGAWAVEGEADNSVSASAGCIKIGGGNKTGRIVTPALDCLTGNAKIEVSFDASPYKEAKWDVLTGRVDVYSAITLNEKRYASEANRTVAQSAKFTLDQVYDWKRYTIVIDNVAPGSYIGIGGSREDGSAAGASQVRMYLDNISIKVIEYK